MEEHTMLPTQHDRKKHTTPDKSLLIMVGLLLSILFVGCRGSAVANSPAADTPGTTLSATATAANTPTLMPSATPKPACIPASPATNPPTPPPIVPNGWATFTDTIIHYSIKYPANWIIPYGVCEGSALDVYNYDPRDGSGSSVFPPGGVKIEALPEDNPTQLSAAAFFQMVQQNQLGGSPCPAYTTQSLNVDGREALLVTCPAMPTLSPLYYVPAGKPAGMQMLSISQYNGQTFSILEQMVESITFLN